MTQKIEGYPLQWPIDRPRTEPSNRERARFSRRSDSGWNNSLSIAQGIGRVMDEVRALKQVDPAEVVISCDIQRRKADGLPMSNRREPDDPGAAVYFELDGAPIVLACDNYDRLADNLAAIAAHMKALRDQARWKVGNLERAYAGYAALPAPGQTAAKGWPEVLGLPADSTLQDAEDQYKRLRSIYHPDRPGGDAVRFDTLNKAINQARAVL
jgi:hypothetical protein